MWDEKLVAPRYWLYKTQIQLVWVEVVNFTAWLEA
jgi:hypothetical protein